MAKLKAEIKGIDSLLLKLNSVKKIHLTDSVKKATVLVQGQAKSLVPTGDSGNLRGSIRMDYKEFTDKVQGRVYTNLEYAPYVEFGTGSKGKGTYPYKIKDVNLTYSDRWFIPASEISEATALKYHFKKIYGKDGNNYYLCYGQPAHPYMYPAIKNSRKQIEKILMSGIRESLKKACKGGK